MKYALNIVTQARSNSLHIPFISPYTPLSLPLSLSRVGSDQAAGKRTGRVHYEKREAAQHLHFTHSLMVSRYTTSVPPLRLCIGPAREAASALLREGGTCHLVGKERII